MYGVHFTLSFLEASLSASPPCVRLSNNVPVSRVMVHVAQEPNLSGIDIYRVLGCSQASTVYEIWLLEEAMSHEACQYKSCDRG